MADSHFHDAARTGDAHVDPDRDAKIDELLLAGLEHYFAGRHQEAINVWGRVLFLDRGQARARAYIERARSALAERQRRSEELLHEGVAAIQRGDGGTARQLLESAAAQGESPEVALAYLQRLEQLNRAVSGTGPEESRVPSRTTGRPPRALMPEALVSRRPRPVRVLPLLLVVVVVGVGVVLAAAFDLLKPLVDMRWARPAVGTAVTVAPDPLPVPRAADLAMARARALAGSGHLRDALGVLDRVLPGDPAWTEADQLRADFQRRLLEAASLMPASAPAPARDGRE